MAASSANLLRSAHRDARKQAVESVAAADGKLSSAMLLKRACSLGGGAGPAGANAVHC
eukprot:SAG11_NODE_22003_length_414_cov_0.815873_1_plen_57_part_10